MHLAEFELDWDARRATRAGRELRLGPKEFYLLGFLLSNPNKIFRREHLARVLWCEPTVDLRTVTAIVSRLRKVINRGGYPDPIRCLRGTGYQFRSTLDGLALQLAKRPKKRKL